jgi:hypothetical protein
MKRTGATGRGRGDHPAKRTLRRFVLGTTSPAENRAIVTHLLRRCSRCSQVLRKLLAEPAGVFRQSGKTEKAS